MIDKLRANPVLVTAVVASIVQLLVGLGLFAEDQGEVVVALLVSAVTALLGLVAREKVSPIDGDATTYVTRERPMVHRRG